MILWHSDKLLSSNLFKFEHSYLRMRWWTEFRKMYNISFREHIVWKHKHVDTFFPQQVFRNAQAHSGYIYFDSVLWVVGENMSVCKSVSNTFRSKGESWIAQPTHCRNVRPEGSSPVVLLEVNGTDTQARMSRNTLREDTEQFRPLHQEHFFSSATSLLKCWFWKLQGLTVSRSTLWFKIRSPLQLRYVRGEYENRLFSHWWASQCFY